MARRTIETNLIGVRVKVREGHGVHANKEGTVRGVYVSKEESSIFGAVMVLIATDSGEIFDTFATVVTII